MKRVLRRILAKRGLLTISWMFLFAITLSAIENSSGTTNNKIQEDGKRTITGKVMDEYGDLLPGVSVVIEGTTIGTITDIEGNYNLVITEGAKYLVFSFVGMEDQRVSLGIENTVNVVLKSGVIGLEEIVAVGYGTTKKKDLTGSVAIVKADEITTKKTTNISEAIQGVVPGVSVTRSSGAPDASTTIRMRGFTTMQGSSVPLILVDDIPVGSIDDVNPNDVQSMSFLKDGAAAAIYGSRAAAGVVIITTKRGRSDKISVNYDYNYFVRTPTRTPKVVGVEKWLQMRNEYEWNDLGNPEGGEFALYSEDYINNYLQNNADSPDEYPNTNWEELLMKDFSTGQRHSFNIYGGNKVLKTNASFTYEKQDALYDHYDYERAIMRVNNDIKISDNIGAVVDFTYKRTVTEKPTVNPTAASRSYPAIYAGQWSDGRVASGKDGSNIWAELQYGGFNDKESHLLYGRLGAWIKPINDLKLSMYYAPNMYFEKNKYFRKSVPYWDWDNPNNEGTPLGYAISSTSLQESRTDNSKNTLQFIGKYNKNFGRHKVEAMAGYEEYSFNEEKLSIEGKEYILQDYPYLDMAPEGQLFANGSNTGEEDKNYRSAFGRVAYNYSSKYYLQANFRADASSRFAEDYRWGYFPSVSAGWLVTGEDFMSSIDAISYLKLRASYGELGNDRLGNYIYMSQIDFANILLSQGNTSVSDVAAAQYQLAIEDIKWEVTKTWDIGVDAAFFNNSLSVTADYYKKETTDMLLSLTTPDLIGYDDPYYNVGDMKTTGWEFSLEYNNKIGDLSYGGGFNISDYTSTIGDVSGRRLFADSSTKLSEEGGEFKEWYGYKTDGIFQTQDEVDAYVTPSSKIGVGDVKYLDISGPEGVPDGIISAEYDKVKLGSSTPHYEYGGNIKLGYKGFQFVATFQGVGEWNRRIYPAMVEPFGERWQNVPDIYEKSYFSYYNTPEQNLKAKYPRLGFQTKSHNYGMSDFWLVDGSYFRLKNINLSYTLPKNIIDKTGIGLSDVKVYFSGSDLFSIDNYPDGWDPEVGSSSYAITKTYLFGISVKL
ncbi:SusC/RagA family TonB-linked outer membrane protein [Saccharicrinis fermentans]|uniref:Outer membrane cobalamin receptor protein n=1 Tax=Saccharicrinis fermentans DSM 9555 = JCM 21142 TaxID=869213 RepID=W7Y9C5_9BACT|nr:TonB-dependent receptor [Saccharicrinis fermentans]GAF04088.1 outer membrane cobalamin receptor protein [Saccharicrinis fermentans DSM 9555 = JCM 21142]